MNILHYSSLVLLIFTQAIGIAQNITWGEDPRKNSKNSYYLVLGENESGVFVLSHSARNGNIQNFAIEKYSHQLFFLTKKYFKLGGGTLERIAVFDTGMAVVHSSRKETPNTNKLIVQMLYDDNHTSTYPKMEWMSLKEDSKFGNSFFSVKNSYNKQHLSVLGVRNMGSKSMVYYQLVNKYAEILFYDSLEVGMPINEKDVQDFFVDSLGNFYGTFEYNNKSFKLGEGRLESHLFVYQYSTKKILNIPITEKPFKATDLTFVYDPKLKHVFLAGLYGPEINSTQKGVLQVQIECESTKVVSSIFSPFQTDFIELVVGKKLADKGEQMSHFFLKKYVRTADGRGVFIAERYFMIMQQDQVMTQGIPVPINQRMYNYDEVICIALESDGSVAWNKVIPKRQTSVDDYGYFSSILVGISPEAIHIVYNERDRRGGDVIQYRVDKDGNMESSVLFNTEKYYSFVVPVEGRQVGYNRLVVPVLKQREYSLVKLTYD